MSTHNKSKNTKSVNRENVRVSIQAASILNLLYRYKKITWPVTVTVRGKGGSGRLFFFRDHEDILSFMDRCEGLQVCYFGVVRDEIMLDLSDDGEVIVNAKEFRKARDGERLTEREVTRFFLERCGDLKKPA